MPTNLPEVPASLIPTYYAGDVSWLGEPYLAGKLGEVVDKIAARWGAVVKSRLDSGQLTARLYEATVVRVAARVFANTEGFKSENAGQYGYDFNPLAASGTIWFADDDVRDLTGVDPKNSSVIGTATIGRHRPGFAS